MLVPWVLVALCVAQCAGGGGASLRGAVEALQRRQRGQRSPSGAVETLQRSQRSPERSDYDALYEFVPPGYPEPDYTEVVDYVDEEPLKYSTNFQKENGDTRSPHDYKYTIVKKRNLAKSNAPKQGSAFRERSLQKNDRLKEIFADSTEPVEPRDEVLKERVQNYEEHNRLLSQLWPKYQMGKPMKPKEPVPQGIVKLYNDKIVKKRYSDNWGPIAYKRKRSSGSDFERPEPRDYEPENKQGLDPNYNSYEASDDDNNDWREEYTIAFQPLGEDAITELGDDNRYSIDSLEKRFPISKRSSESFELNNKEKRSDRISNLRSNSGTDPKIIKDLSKIFGEDVEIMKTPVKRNVDHEISHETMPPKIAAMSHNGTNEHSNYTHYEIDSHEQHQSHMHHPGHEGMKEIEPDNTAELNNHGGHEKPIVVRKKSIDWSDYFGIDKRAKKFLSDTRQDHLKKQYFDTFNKEVISPLNSFKKHSYAKRNYGQAKPVQELESHEVRAAEKHLARTDSDSKRENLDKKLRDMEGILVDEALHYSDAGEELDSKEEQEMKEKLLSELAAAYSLEKMRKALKEFKQNLQAQRSFHTPPTPNDQMKAKRVAVKKELMNNDIPAFNKHQEKYDDFEEDQGAGHYSNGNEEQYTEGYTSSGRHRYPAALNVFSSSGSCPVLTKIVQRCRGVDILAGDRGQLFLPLCSLHQICYLCGEAPQTTCDLVFLSEADTSCEGDVSCQQAARAALMSLRDLHDNLADELDGECETSPCLSQTLKLNEGWQRAMQR